MTTIKLPKYLRLILLLLLLPLSGHSQGLPVIDATNLTQKLLQALRDTAHYAEEVQQIYAWYEQAQLIRDNLESIDGYQDLFPFILEVTDDRHGVFILDRMFRLDPRSGDYFERLYRLIDEYYFMARPNEIAIDYQEGYLLDENYDRFYEMVERHEARKLKMMDVAHFISAQEDVGSSRRQEISSLQQRASEIESNDEMAALQLLIAQNYLTHSQLETLIESNQVTLSAVHDDMIQRISRQDERYKRQYEYRQRLQSYRYEIINPDAALKSF